MSADPTPYVHIKDLLFPGASDAWEMLNAERLVLAAVMNAVRPRVSVEIGTRNGGSTGTIARHSGRVFCLDMDPAVPGRLAGRFDNVECVVGDSRATLPATLQRLHAAGDGPGFILIDGDHTAEGVRADIENVLRFPPQAPLVVLLHDSFNPPCRQGMLDARWGACPYVHYAEIDLVAGQLIAGPDGSAQMWGGFGMAYLHPVARTGPVQVQQSGRAAYLAAVERSVHRPARRGIAAWLRRGA